MTKYLKKNIEMVYNKPTRGGCELLEFNVLYTGNKHISKSKSKVPHYIFASKTRGILFRLGAIRKQIRCYNLLITIEKVSERLTRCPCSVKLHKTINWSSRTSWFQINQSSQLLAGLTKNVKVKIIFEVSLYLLIAIYFGMC